MYAIYPLFEYYPLAEKMHGLVRAGDPLPEATVERSPIMSSASSLAKVIAPSDETAQAAEIVEKFLVASMVPDPETAAKYIAEPLKLTFTGGRKFTHPR